MSLNLMRIRKGIAGPARTARVKSGILRGLRGPCAQGMILEGGDEGAEECCGEDERPGGNPGEEEKREGGEGEEDVGDGVERGSGEGADKGGEENSDDARIDSAKGRAKGGAGAEGAPKGEDSGDEEQAGKEDADEGGEAEERGVVRGNADGGTEVCGEGEEWAGNGLGCSVTGEEAGLGEPAWGGDCGFKQGKDYVASTEDERSAAIEGGDERDEGCGAGAGGQFGGDEEEQEESCGDKAGGAGDGRGWGFEGLGGVWCATD